MWRKPVFCALGTCNAFVSDFAAAAPKRWNDLPLHVRQASSMSHLFAKTLKAPSLNPAPQNNTTNPR